MGLAEETSAASVAALAAVAAKLKPRSLTKVEKAQFSTRKTEYLKLRNKILAKWWQNSTHFLTAEECIEDNTISSKPKFITEVHQFLMEQGAINFGLVDDPVSEVEEGVVSDDVLVDKVFELLKTVDLEQTSLKALRKMLEVQLGLPDGKLDEKKHLLKAQVQKYVKGEVPPSRPKVETRVLGKVIVVGAGPAGLTAALHLKRNGAEVVVLEARSRPGGRVHTQHGKLSVPVDLGASIITGVETDVKAKMAADRSALLFRQIGSELVEWPEPLPLYDGVTGELVPTNVDTMVDKLCNRLLDEAAELEEEEGAEGMSLQEGVDRAFAKLQDDPLWYQGDSDQESEEVKRDATNRKRANKRQVVMQNGKSTQNSNQQPAYKGDGRNGTSTTNDHTLTIPPPDTTTPLPDPKIEAQQQNASDNAPATITTQNTTAHNCSTTEEQVHPDMTNTAVKSINDAAGENPNNPKNDNVDINTDINTDITESEGRVRVDHPDADKGDAGGKMDVKVESEPGAEQAADGRGEGMCLEGGGEGQQGGTKFKAIKDFTDAEMRLLHWHWANLEYGCSAPLSQVSLIHWNQDEDLGGFAGMHCMVKGGYSPIMERMAGKVDVRYNTPVTAVSHTDEHVTVTSQDGETFTGDAVIVTVPLGCLKSNDIAFTPPLPSWKQEAINRLGFGQLNKIILEFEEVFWNDSVYFFGAASDQSLEGRGRCFMFWNLHKLCGVPVLAGLMAGHAARQAEDMSDQQLQECALGVLRNLFGNDKVCEPKACAASRWGSEQYTKGSYSYVHVGSSGEDYDILAKPVTRRVRFAGEHTIKEHPDTVGGAILTGLREAIRVLQLLKGKDEEPDIFSDSKPAKPGDEPLDRKRHRGGRARLSHKSLHVIPFSDEEEEEPHSEAPSSEASLRSEDMERPDDMDIDTDQKVTSRKRPQKIEKKEETRKKKRRQRDTSTERESQEPSKKKKKKKDDRGGDGDTAKSNIWKYIKLPGVPEDYKNASEQSRSERSDESEGVEEEDVDQEVRRMGGRYEPIRVDRAPLTAIWKAILTASRGDVSGVLSLMQDTSEVELRAAFIRSLNKAQPGVLSSIAGSALCMKTLCNWFNEYSDSPSTYPLLDEALQLLLRLPVTMAVLKGNGMAKLVRGYATEHGSKDVRSSASMVLKHWVEAGPNQADKKHAVGSNATFRNTLQLISNASKATKSASAPPPPPPAIPPRPEQPLTSSAHTEGGPAVDPRRRPPVVPDPPTTTPPAHGSAVPWDKMEEMLEPQLREKLAAASEAARKAEIVAQAYAAQAADLAQHAEYDLEKLKLPRIEEFDAFAKAKAKHKAKKSGSAGGSGGPYISPPHSSRKESTHPKATPSSNGKEAVEGSRRLEGSMATAKKGEARGAAGGGKDRGVKERTSVVPSKVGVASIPSTKGRSSVVPSRNAEPGPSSKATNGSVSRHTAAGASEEAAKQLVGDYVTSLLQPLYKKGAITREQFKKIFTEVRKKVLEKGVGAQGLHDKHKEKINLLVDRYVKQAGSQ